VFHVGENLVGELSDICFEFREVQDDERDVVFEGVCEEDGSHIVLVEEFDTVGGFVCCYFCKTCRLAEPHSPLCEPTS